MTTCDFSFTPETCELVQRLTNNRDFGTIAALQALLDCPTGPMAHEATKFDKRYPLALAYGLRRQGPGMLYADLRRAVLELSNHSFQTDL